MMKIFLTAILLKTRTPVIQAFRAGFSGCLSGLNNPDDTELSVTNPYLTVSDAAYGSGNPRASFAQVGTFGALV
jgi:hypothetical protein